MPALTLDTPHAAPEVMISAQQIHKSFGATNVLRGISLQLQRGEVVAIIGPSGSGKSTFLRCLNHLETIDSGTITVEGDVLVQNDANGRAAYASDSQIRSIGRKMGMVFQSFNLFPHLTVLENIIEAPMLVKKMARAAIVPQAEQLLQKVACWTSAMPTPTASRAGKNSAWPLPGRWPWGRIFCCLTSRPRPWTPS